MTSLARVTEQARSRGAERLHDPAIVDDDHRVRNGVENRAQVRFTRECVLGAGRCMETRSPQGLADPGDTGSDGAKGYGVHEVAPRERVVAP